MSTVFCPHCALVLAEEVAIPYPPSPVRCRHCRLVVGPARGRPEPDATAGARGAAAGRYASEARRVAAAAVRDGAPAVPEEERVRLAGAVRDVARALDRRVGQVTLIDYQERAELRSELPELSEVIAAFGTWKSALAAAAALDPAPA
jgi:hypothetical protein